MIVRYNGNPYDRAAAKQIFAAADAGQILQTIGQPASSGGCGCGGHRGHGMGCGNCPQARLGCGGMQATGIRIDPRRLR